MGTLRNSSILLIKREDRAGEYWLQLGGRGWVVLIFSFILFKIAIFDTIK